MNFIRNIWPQSDPRPGDPDDFPSGYGMHPAIVKLTLANGGTPLGPDPRSRIDLTIGWRKLRDVLANR
jgi:hypothetical protein